MISRTFPGLLALAAAASFAPADDAGAAPVATPPNPVAEFEFPQLEGKRSLDATGIPGQVRMDFLHSGLRAYIANRLNGVANRHAKDEKVIAWNAYDEATKADPLQSAVPKPDFERPATPDFEAAYARAIEDLTSGNIRKVGDTPKPRATKDPLIATVTGVVEREVFNARRAEDPKYSFLAAKKEVGGDGIAYLNAMIEAKVAAGADRTEMEKVRDTKYINPAKAMLGLSSGKALNGLPSIL